MHILDKIVKHKKVEVENNKLLASTAVLEQSPLFERKCYSLSKYIRDNDRVGIIAEFKRRSPSKPTINLNADPKRIPAAYDLAGVSAISILTDHHFFGGNSHHLVYARPDVTVPILRKDFIIDEYQIIEAKSIGADAILLITEILTKDEIKRFSALALSLGLECLMEIHTEEQIQKYNSNISCIGVNNRDLTKFVVDPEHSVRLYPKLPQEACKISESGIHNIDTMIKLRSTGYDGFLIGERFMKTEDPGRACKDFIQALKKEINAD